MTLFLAAYACRAQVSTKLSSKFATPEDALRFYQAPLESRHSPAPAPVLHKRSSSTQTDGSVRHDHILSSMKCLLDSLPSSERASIINDLMQSLSSDLHVPSDFVSSSLACMERLKKCGRSNLLYGLAKALGTMRPDGSDSLMPMAHMPVGLIEYAASFFTSDSMYQVCNYYRCTSAIILFYLYLSGHQMPRRLQALV